MLRASDVGRGEDVTALLSEENFRPLQVPRRARIRPGRALSARRPPLSCRLVVALTGGAVGAAQLPRGKGAALPDRTPADGVRGVEGHLLAHIIEAGASISEAIRVCFGRGFGLFRAYFRSVLYFRSV
jgi:hypothetical protein